MRKQIFRNFISELDYGIPIRVKYRINDGEIIVCSVTVSGKEIPIPDDGLDQLIFDIQEDIDDPVEDEILLDDEIEIDYKNIVTFSKN